MMEKNLFSANNIVFRYGHHTAIDDVTFTIDQGEFVGVIGPNGAGKSTLIRLLAGFLSPEQGIYNILRPQPRRIQ